MRAMQKEEMNVRCGPQREASDLWESGKAKTRKRSKNEHGLRCVLLLIRNQHSLDSVCLPVQERGPLTHSSLCQFYILNIPVLASIEYRFSLFLYLLSHYTEFLVNNRAVGYSCESPGPRQYPWISIVIWQLLDHTYVN